MVCPVTPDGPCLLTSDGACTAPKVSGVLPELESLYASGTADGLTLSWSTTTSYPDQRVLLLCKVVGGSTYARTSTARDLGTITITGFPADAAIAYSIRPETDTEYGEWHIGQGVSDPTWNQDSELVTFYGDDVTHDSIPIFMT